MSKYHWITLGVLGLAIISGIIFFNIPFVKGLDIDGGMRVVLEVDKEKAFDWAKDNLAQRREQMETAQNTIQSRVKGIQGVSEPQVVLQGEDRVIVEIPGVKNPEDALDRIKSTASLEFYYLRNVQSLNDTEAEWKMNASGADAKSYTFVNSVTGEVIDSEKQPVEVLEKVVNYKKYPPELTGKDLIANAKSTINPSNNSAVITIEFNQKGTKKFADFTRKHVDDLLAVFFDGKLLTAPKINEPIVDGNAEVSGFQSLKEAHRTAVFLNSGALPVPLRIIAQDTVEPTLGLETVNMVIHAGIIGLILVILFMLGVYRLPGFIASVALCLYAVFTMAIFKLLNVTMSLPGVAALIISIGMAVDANILIFERLKEELKSGKTLHAAIDAGFGRAFTAIFDSNMCTAITCAILMHYGTPSVQSFALTLLIGVAISMFTAITATRSILHLFVSVDAFHKPWWYGISSDVTKKPLSWNIIGKRKLYFWLSGILIIPGVILLIIFGLKLGIEFKPGSTFQYTFKQAVSIKDVKDIASTVSESNEVQIGKAKDGQNKIAYIKLPNPNKSSEIMNTQGRELTKKLDEGIGIAKRDDNDKPVADLSSNVDPTISKELTSKAILSVIVASLAIILYLTSRFAIGGFVQGLKFGVCAVIALLHDTLFILGMFAILGKYFGWEVDSLFVTAVLTVIGFSVHDTIVVFDRIRENLRHRLRGEAFEDLCNRSILQTITRSIYTSFTVVLTLTTLIVLGGPLLRHFYVALLAGIIIGTYSSIFNAAPLVVVWNNMTSGGMEKTKKPADTASLYTSAIPSSDSGSIQGDLLAEDIDEENTAKVAEAKAKAAKKKPTVKKRRF